MYNIGAAFKRIAESDDRQILVKALFNEETELTGANLLNMTVTEAVNASDGLSMGATISSRLVMTLKAQETPLALTGGIVRPYAGFYGAASEDPQLSDDGVLIYPEIPELSENGVLILSDYIINDEVLTSSGNYCPLGKFYITEAVSNDDFKTAFTMTGYDGFCKTEIPYTPQINMPNTAEAILADIAAQCNFEIGADISYPEGEFGLYDFTCRQYIGYFAGLLGKNARFNRDGYLTFAWYTDQSYSINRELQYMGGFKRLTDSDFVVQSISSGTSDNILVAGTGVGISFENPFITQEALDSIFKNTCPLAYTPAKLKWRGNPAIEAGDIIVAEDKDGIPHEVYIMEHTIRVSGGMYSEIKCYGESETAINFDTSPQSKKLKQVYTKLQEAIAEATRLLNGANGGVFEIIDEDGDEVNDGWIIHSADGQKFIKANINGIGITQDGGATYKEAITANGINASVINTGALNAERIAVENYDESDPTKLTDYIHFGNGTITLGKGDNAIILKLENNQVAFYNTSGTRLGRFTNNAFEIENLEDGQIRFQNFGFIPRTSGNISFTKLI